jgi:hypothetical protein
MRRGDLMFGGVAVLMIAGVAALPSHATSTEVAPPVNIKPPHICIKHQPYTKLDGSTGYHCERIA